MEQTGKVRCFCKIQQGVARKISTRPERATSANDRTRTNSSSMQAKLGHNKLLLHGRSKNPNIKRLTTNKKT